MGHRMFERLDPAGRRGYRIGALAGAAGLTLLLFAGCTNSPTNASMAGSSSAMVDEPTTVAAAGPAVAAGASAAGSSAAAPSSAAPSSAAASAAGGGSTGSGKSEVNVEAGVQGQNRQVIRTAGLTLQIGVKSTGNGTAQVAADKARVEEDVQAVAVKVRVLATGAGFVSASDGGGATLSITLRVPVTAYEGVMTQLSHMDVANADSVTLSSLNENTQDVTAQMIDIDSRTKSAAGVIASLRTLLSKATKIGDILSIESQLNGREADLESLKSQLAGLSDQTSLSTITVVLQGKVTDLKPVVAPEEPAPPAARSGFLGGLANGWHAARSMGHGVLTVVGTLIPFLPLVLVIVVGLMIWRRRMRRDHPVLGKTAGDPHPAD